MRAFMDADFLLQTETARTLFHEHAESQPILDYHCHINPAEIAADRQFSSITEVWLGGDHYKWRAMRSAGVPENLITGDADPRDKFRAWAQTMPGLIGNPLYHWTHMELQRYFGITEPLSGKNADEVYDACNRMLASPDMSVRNLIRRSNVEVICTTDDPIDSLEHHSALAAEKDLGFHVYPAFRPDKALRVDKPEFAGYIAKLEAVAGRPIRTVDDLRAALTDRIRYFQEHGCRVADHALDTCICTLADDSELNRILSKALAGQPASKEESEAFQTALLLTCAESYTKYGWVMQLHYGCIRNLSSRMFRRLGADTGFDASNDEGRNAVRLAAFLDLLESRGALPKTILYSLNPADNIVNGTIMGCFQTDSPVAGRIQLGSAWWFNDHKAGMEKQLTDLMDLGYIGGFIGMLTDSRSFLSYTRHEYFRRILCNLCGNLVENGEYPADPEMLAALVEGISYRNAKHYFGF